MLWSDEDATAAEAKNDCEEVFPPQLLSLDKPRVQQLIPWLWNDGKGQGQAQR